MLAVIGASCGQPKFRIVNNGAEKTYTKIPRAWTEFPVSTERTDRIDPKFSEDVSLLWSIGFDADPKSDVAHVTQLFAFDALDFPVGQLNVYQIQGNYAQNLSLAGARTDPFGVDPLNVPDKVQDLVEVGDYQPLAPSTGLQGSRVIFNVRPNADSPWNTYDMVTAFDQSRKRMYTMIVGCSGKCFEDNRHEISQIVTSWKVDR